MLPKTQGDVANQDVIGWMQFASTLRLTQLSREINTEETSAAGLLAEIDRYCTEIRSANVKSMSVDGVLYKQKVCDSLIHRASSQEIIEGSNAFLRQKLMYALGRLEEVKTNLRKVRRRSALPDQLYDLIIPPKEDDTTSRIDIGKYRSSNRLIDLRLHEGIAGNSEMNDSGDKEWNKLLTGHPSPTQTTKNLPKLKQADLDILNANQDIPKKSPVQGKKDALEFDLKAPEQSGKPAKISLTDRHLNGKTKVANDQLDSSNIRSRHVG